MRTLKEYAAYKGEQFLVVGTIKEVATYLGIKENVARKMSYKSYHNRSGEDSKQVMIYKLEEEADEEHTSRFEQLPI